MADKDDRRFSGGYQPIDHIDPGRFVWMIRLGHLGENQTNIFGFQLLTQPMKSRLIWSAGVAMDEYDGSDWISH
jgi:hypothetical protein